MQGGNVGAMQAKGGVHIAVETWCACARVSRERGEGFARVTGEAAAAAALVPRPRPCLVRCPFLLAEC